jgi:hypothetical protein
MSKRQRDWANRAKAELFQRMGNCCWKCGATSELEFDHPNGRDWSIRRTEFSWRVSRYRQEWNSGVGQILCKTCNSNRPGYILYPPPPGVRAPFRVEPSLSVHGAGEVPF